MSPTKTKTITDEAEAKPTAQSQQSSSQTLMRGLDVIEAVAGGPIALIDLAKRLGLNRSTTHRLANALVERRYLSFRPRSGYRLGPKLLELGFIAQDSVDLVRVARPHLEALSAATEDAVHLGVLDEGSVLKIDKIEGRRRVQVNSRIGDRHSVTATGLGQAMLLDHDPKSWHGYFIAEESEARDVVDYSVWSERMNEYARHGYAFAIHENEDRIRCVAAPIRNAAGQIVAAISVSSAAQYMGDDRMKEVALEVRATAAAISRQLGWSPPALRGGSARAGKA